MVGISETKFDDSISSSEIKTSINRSLAYNYKDNFCKSSQTIFVDIFPTKTKPISVGILYRPSEKSDFVKSLEENFK